MTSVTPVSGGDVSDRGHRRGRRSRLASRVALLALALVVVAAAPAGAAGGADDGPRGPAARRVVTGDAPVVAIVFPVAGPHRFVDDWHAPRDGGTRLHQGIDIFADKHTPVVAAVDGTVVQVRVADGNRAGNMVVLAGDDGRRYYYVHLDNDAPGTDDGSNRPEFAFAPGIAIGVRVGAGDPLGYVGDSGNAENTPAHLHFEIVGPDGVNLDPYPSLVVADGGDASALVGRLARTGSSDGALALSGVVLVAVGMACVYVAERRMVPALASTPATTRPDGTGPVPAHVSSTGGRGWVLVVLALLAATAVSRSRRRRR